MPPLARLCTVAGFYKYAVEEELLEHSPAVYVRRPQLDYESHAAGLDRNEVGALLVAALVLLLALNGLRVSEATGADIKALGTERGHRTLTITRKGGKTGIIRLAPRTARAIDLAVGERCEGPIFTTAAGRRLDRHGAGRIVRRVARRAGLAKKRRSADLPWATSAATACPGCCAALIQWAVADVTRTSKDLKALA
jgi:integrase